MKEMLEKIQKSALDEIAQGVATEDIRIKYLGKKGELTKVLRGMGALSAEERPIVGALANTVRANIETALKDAVAAEEAKKLDEKLKKEKLDVTFPGKEIARGHRHPIYETEQTLRDIFIGLGFSIVEGPEVEYDYYNFEALNIPKDHPARDTQDTLYISDNILLRSQTSPVR